MLSRFTLLESVETLAFSWNDFVEQAPRDFLSEDLKRKDERFVERKLISIATLDAYSVTSYAN